VRGLDYYNGLCFEIQMCSDDPEMNAVLGQQQSTLLAGGRYDYLANQFGYKGKHLPSVGWAAGVDRIMMVLQALE
jgi:histidyl-tRNA synthetase